MNSATESIVTILVAITGVAILAVLVSRKSQTAAVIQAAGSAFSNALSTAVSPVTGVGGPANLSYPNAGNWGLNGMLGMGLGTFGPN